MRWKKLSARRFGPLRHWEGRLDKPVVVFMGRNEAGKSTMMELMCTLLFGGHRRKAANQRLIAWGSRDAEIEGELTRDDGSELSVQRLLSASGIKGSLVEDGCLQELDNGPLPEIHPLGRELYGNIYALSLQDLLFPRREAWTLIQDQMLGAGGNNNRPVSQVRDELYHSAMGAWRPDRRGKTRMDALDQELRTLYDRLNQVQNAGREVDDLFRQQEQTQAEIEQLRRLEQQLKAQLEEAVAQRERATRAQEGRALLSFAGDVSMFDALPQNAEATLEELKARQKALANQIAESGRTLAKMIDKTERFTVREKRLVDRAEQINGYYARYSDLQNLADELPGVKAEAQQTAMHAARYLSEQMLDPTAERQDTDLPMGALQELAIRARDAGVAYNEAKERLADSRSRVRTPLPALLSVLGGLLLAGAAVAIPPLGLVKLPLPDWMATSILAVLGLAAFVGITPLTNRIRNRKTSALQEMAETAGQLDEQATHELNQLLGSLSLREELLDDPDELAKRCQRYAQLSGENEELRAQCTQMEDEWAHETDQIQALARELLPELQEEDPLVSLKALKEAADEAQRWKADSERLMRRMEEEKAWLADLKRHQQRAVDEEQTITNILHHVPGRDVHEQIAQVRAWQKAAHRGEALLENADAMPTVEELDESVSAMRQELDNVVNRLQQLYNSQGAMGQNITHLNERPSEAEILAEIERLTEEQNELAQERDQQALLYALLNVSEQRFRDQHQPDVVRRASSYLSQITGGRYSRLAMNEDNNGIRLYSPDAGTFIDPEESRLSQGTIEQVFLSLRLALVDHLDPNGESLPLLLDETFVNWDHDRLVQGLTVLAQVASRRQLIFFTCHDWMLEAMEEAGLDYQLVSMEDAHA